MDEGEAIGRLKQGDIGALAVLMERYQAPAMRTAYLVIRDRAMAEDIVQGAFLRAFERIGQFDSRRPFGPWFLRSVFRDALKAVARRGRHVPLDTAATPGAVPPHGREGSPAEQLADARPGPEEALEHAETRAAVAAALAALPPAQRTAVVLRYWHGQSEQEMAEALLCPPGTIKSRLHAARERLRAFLRPLLEPTPPRQPRLALLPA
ncbi:MAG TPA: sigma-70 family RNA polymerase sigma factor [Chloroflexota bacterium]|nr:sigma-70 family RNA polymerase sigma factor [Chloroflexota bacterium]